MADSNFIVLVTVPNEVALMVLHDMALHAGCNTVINYEPDVNNEATAVVLEGPNARRLCSHLPLMGREVAMA